jgi:hypothetical protein
MNLADFMQLPASMQPIELISGELIISPVPKNSHQRLIGQFHSLLGTIKENGDLAIFSSLFLDNENVPIPNVFWVREGSKACQIQDDDYWHGVFNKEDTFDSPVLGKSVDLSLVF